MLLNKPVIIGIAGGSASGKTTIAQKIIDTFKDTNSIGIIKEDDYYKDQSDLSFEDRKKTNYDHPLAFDHELMRFQIQELIAGRIVEKPTQIVEPKDVIIIEGLFVLEEKEIRDLLDIKVFLDTPNDIRFIRRLVGDINERGRDINNIIDQWCATVRVMHDEFIEPSKKYADVIIPEGGGNSVGIDLLITKIDSILNQTYVKIVVAEVNYGRENLCHRRRFTRFKK